MHLPKPLKLWNVNATNKSDEYAVKAIQLLKNCLPELVNNPTIELRNKASEGAYLSGKAINITKTTAPHAFSYPFTTFYGLPHGHAVAMTFPIFAAFNYCESQNLYNGQGDVLIHHRKMDRLYEMLGIQDKTTARKQMRDYIGSLGLSLQKPSGFDSHLILSNVNTQRMANNPVKLVHIEADFLD